MSPRGCFGAVALGLWLLANHAQAQSAAVTEARQHMEAGRYSDAGSAFRRAFAETHNPVYLKQAGEAYLALGAAGRSDAIQSFRLYEQNADSQAQILEARQLIQRAEALPVPTPTAPTPPTPVPPAPDPAPPPAAPPTPAPSAEPSPLGAAPGTAPPPNAVTEVGVARWTAGLGFVSPPAAPAAGEAGESGEVGVQVPEARDVSMEGVRLLLIAGMTTLNPVNDGVTDDDTAMDLLEVGMFVGGDFYNQASLLGIWFDVGFTFMLGEREDPGIQTVFGVQSLRPRARLGLDAHVGGWLALGPFVGGSADLYAGNFTASDDAPNAGEKLTHNKLEPDLAVLLGAHLKLHTRERPGDPAVFYVDPRLTYRMGQQSALYGGAELGVGGGGVYVVGYVDQRLSTSGSFTAEDATDDGEPDAAKALAYSTPIEFRAGGGLRILF